MFMAFASLGLQPVCWSVCAASNHMTRRTFVAAELARAEAALAEINRPFQLGQHVLGIFLYPVLWLGLGTAAAVYGGNQLSMIAAGAPRARVEILPEVSVCGGRATVFMGWSPACTG